MGDVEAVIADDEEVVAVVEAGICHGVDREFLGVGILQLALLDLRHIGVHGGGGSFDRVLHLGPLQVEHVDPGLAERDSNARDGDDGGQNRDQPE